MNATAIRLYTLAKTLDNANDVKVVRQAAQMFSQSPHALDRLELYAALDEMLPLYKNFLDAEGGCDHSVGICSCADEQALRRVTQALAKVRPEEIT